FQHMIPEPIDDAVLPPRLFEAQRLVASETSQDKSGDYFALQRIAKPVQIRDTPDRLRHENETVCPSAPFPIHDPPVKKSGNDWSAKLIIGHGRVAHVGADQHFSIAFAGQEGMGVVELPVFELAVDAG